MGSQSDTCVHTRNCLALVVVRIRMRSTKTMRKIRSCERHQLRGSLEHRHLEARLALRQIIASNLRNESDRRHHATAAYCERLRDSVFRTRTQRRETLASRVLFGQEELHDLAVTVYYTYGESIRKGNVSCCPPFGGHETASAQCSSLALSVDDVNAFTTIAATSAVSSTPQNPIAIASTRASRVLGAKSP